jgi:hypothetical protein
MEQQNYRPFEDILIITPDFKYEHDDLFHPHGAIWNSSKPWGEWRVGAESTPNCCGKSGRIISSFNLLDHMLAMLTGKTLFPRMNKISYVWDIRLVDKLNGATICRHDCLRSLEGY